MGVVFALALLVGTVLLTLARLNPWLARRIAGSGFAVVLLLAIWDVMALLLRPRYD
jgi:hypothetical protein